MNHSALRERPFRPPLWSVLVSAAAFSAFCALGAWQVHRGDEKRALLAQALSAAQKPPIVLSRQSLAGAGVTRAAAAGEYLADRQLLQDGQSHEGQPGVHVWSPLRLTDGALLIVDRGWVPQPRPDAELSPPAGAVALTGLWRALPEPAWRLDTPACVRAQKFPATVLYPDAATLACVLGEPALAGVLLLDPGQPGGYVRQWQDLGFPPERHYAYAAQWFAFAAITLTLFLRLNFKRR